MQGEPSEPQSREGPAGGPRLEDFILLVEGLPDYRPGAANGGGRVGKPAVLGVGWPIERDKRLPGEEIEGGLALSLVGRLLGDGRVNRHGETDDGLDDGRLAG